MLTGRPIGLALGQHRIINQQINGARFGINRNFIAIFNQRNRATICCLWADMANEETACRTGKAAIGNQRNLIAIALTVNR